MSYTDQYIGQTITIHIDRPLWSMHPKHNFIYCLNYGYIPDTIAPDGDEIDAYILGTFEPLEVFEGVCIAIIRRENDDDDKLIVVPQWKDYTNEQIVALTEFQERFFQSHIVR